ncbi:dihydrodipicolinate synthase family protein [Rhizobium sp. ZPR3]|uniref:Dihydrodipicolinate synthase family protein n=2 Tax=unclassified Rhizobium TaxID=2613769 RepID=A0AAU7SRL3_9HYPH
MNDKRARVQWRGYIPAITTPFDAERKLDITGLGLLLEWLHAEGMHGLVIGGTTGEWFSLNDRERHQLFSAAGSQMRGRLPLIAGCSAYTPDEVLRHIEHAHGCGFEGVLITPPPYALPDENDLFAFYAHIAQRSRLPICIYNWPPGTNIDMSFDLLSRLAELDAVVAIKQSTSDLSRFIKTFFSLKDQVRVFGLPMDELGITLVTAHDADGTMGAGGVLGHYQPGFYDNLWRGDVDAARACGAKDRVLMRDWFTPALTGKFGSGAAILKAALNARGLPGGYVRPPFQDVSSADAAQIAQTLRSLDCIPVGKVQTV